MTVKKRPRSIVPNRPGYLVTLLLGPEFADTVLTLVIHAYTLREAREMALKRFPGAICIKAKSYRGD